MLSIHWISGPCRPVVFVSLLLAGTQISPSGAVVRQDRAWKVYLNRATGFCISYPSRWYRSETYDGSGLAVTTGIKKRSPIPVGSMDVSALATSTGQPHAASLALDDDLDLRLAGLKKFVRAERVEILEKRSVSLGTSPSLFVKIRYLDPRDRRVWIDEVIFARGRSLSYRLELETRADQLERFEANFAQFANSFQMECSRGTSSAAASNVSAFRLAQ